MTSTGAPVRFRCRISRTCVQDYPERVGREFRPRSEVFHADSLRSLAGVKVQISHDPTAPSVGRVLDEPFARETLADGHEYLLCTIEVNALTASQIDAGVLSGLSAGYSCELEMTPGVAPDGHHYDAIQRRIVFDHIAVLRTYYDAPRCGASCSIQGRTDSQMKVTRHTDGMIVKDASAVTCNCDQAERDRVQAYLDTYSERIGVTCDALVNEVIRVHGNEVHASKELIVQAAERLAPRGVYVTHNSPAQYHDGIRANSAPRVNLDSDDAFRKQLDTQLKADGVHNDAAPADTAGTVLNLDSDDDAFRKFLATKDAQ